MGELGDIWIKNATSYPHMGDALATLATPDGSRWTLELLVPIKLWTLLPAMQASSDDDDDYLWLHDDDDDDGGEDDEKMKDRIPGWIQISRLN